PSRINENVMSFRMCLSLGTQRYHVSRQPACIRASRHASMAEGPEVAQPAARLREALEHPDIGLIADHGSRQRGVIVGKAERKRIALKQVLRAQVRNGTLGSAGDVDRIEQPLGTLASRQGVELTAVGRPGNRGTPGSHLARL